MRKNMSVHRALEHLPLLVKTCNLIEDVLSEELYQAIEQLIRNSQSELTPDLRWQTVRWDVCANFEYKEIWFAPSIWNINQTDSSHLNIEQCYAYFKLTIQNHNERAISIDDDFANNGNRLPTVNFFNHANGFVSIQFHLNKSMIKNIGDKETHYSVLSNWGKRRNQLIQQYNELAYHGFKLSEMGSFWYLPIPVLDGCQVASDFDRKYFDQSLDPIRDALKTIYPVLDIFDLIQKQAKLYK
ncbi:hypothetical protein B9T26_05555 [Acinetobacter sp. ANC 4169]|uniref:hypothetical protein n=1 Tax=Acinetobacter sp. ANC 4169 TaxID=1977879 RepID=UPI000A343A96|nr:hypothetical protein [Acinetobacter sp. ANC 4169]OTG75450.1 hypothetical protein B9T26_05555 [Acinetobacter sp. ANC 4169]